MPDPLEAYREALTPSGETKATYMGEFHIIQGNRRIPVPWTTIKEIMHAIKRRAENAPSRDELMGDL